MTVSAKANEIAHTIAQNIKLRQSALAVTESFDTDGFPLVQLGTGAIGAAGGLIKVQPVDWPLAKDILGLTATNFGPHRVQIVTESNPAGGAGADINTAAQLLLVLGDAILSGCQIEWYQSANGNAADPSDIIAGNLKATLGAHPVYGMIASQ